MSKLELPSSAWLAAEFLKIWQICWFAEDVYEYKAGLYRLVSRQWLQATVQAFLVDALGVEKVSSSCVNEVCHSVKNHAYLDERRNPPFWIKDGREANVVVAANAIVNLDPLTTAGRVECIPHTPELFALCGVPYQFDPDARCPKWLKFLDWMVGGNEGEARLLQQFCAWTFVAKRLRLERILWLCGPGRNGKSTFLKIVRYVIGESATSAVGLDAFGGGENFKLWPTLHKQANFCCDAQVKKTSNVASLNAYISGDPFTINRKFREQLTLEPATVCFFASNAQPLYLDDSDAFWRRLLLILCRQRLSEEQADPGLVDDLKAEAAGIFSNWMLEPIPHLLAQKRFDIPQSVRENVEALKSEVNASRQFIREKVQAGDPVRDWITRDQLMGMFHLWCDTNGFKRESLPLMKDELRRAFNTEATRRRKGMTPGERVQCWMGVKWKPEENVRTVDVAAKRNDYLQALVQDKEVDFELMRAEKDAEIARLKEQIHDGAARGKREPPSAPPNPAKMETTELRRVPPPEAIVPPLESEPDGDSETPGDAEELASLLAKLGGKEGSHADSPDAP
jgi:putative DNA primase/helicase